MSSSFLSGTDVSGKTFEPQRSNLGYVIFIFGNNKLGQVVNKISSDATSLLAISLEEFAVPKVSVNTFDVRWNGARRKQVSSVENDDWVISVRDYIDQPSAKILSAWFTLVYNGRTGQIGKYSEATCEAVVVLFDGSTGKPNRVVKVADVSITSLDSGSISHGDADTVKVEATFSIGRVDLLTEAEMNELDIPTKMPPLTEHISFSDKKLFGISYKGVTIGRNVVPF